MKHVVYFTPIPLLLQDIIATLGVRLGPALKLIAAAMIVKSKSPQPRSKN